MIDQIEDAIIAASAFACFWIIFTVSWWISLRYCGSQFQSYTSNEKAEWCSRVCSTVHATIIIPGAIYCLMANEWETDEIAYSSPQTCRTMFDISIGYFFQDLISLAYWKLQYWQAFIVHHIVGMTPYMINNFVPDCHCGNYVLAFFLLVEIPTLPLNCVGVMDQLGMRDSSFRFFAFLLMYALWFLARVILPIYLLVVIYEIILPTWYSERTTEDFLVCTIPSTVAANIIAFFCFYIFLTQLSIDMFKECVQPVYGKKGGTVIESPIGIVSSSIEGRESLTSVRRFQTYGAVTGDIDPNQSNGESSEDEEVFGITQMYRKKKSSQLHRKSEATKQASPKYFEDDESNDRYSKI